MAVAFSGGRDSTALLHATLVACRGTELQVAALHVHHGLQSDADDWLAHCAATCRRWARSDTPLRFEHRRLQGKPEGGESVEAWARRERYRALAEMARSVGASAVLLGHHRRDQAETLLLQALRGAGVAGLAAMPRSLRRDDMTWLRPWLDVPHASIAAYVKRHRLRHIHDGSNEDQRFARNRLRIAVWPALTDAFPAAELSLAGSARWSQEAAALLAEVADEDLIRIGDGAGLRVAALLALSPARRSNALRRWLAIVSGQSAPASLVQRLMVELESTKASRWPMPKGELRRHRGLLKFVEFESAPHAEPINEQPLSIRRAGRYRLDSWRGVLHATRVAEQGIALSQLARLRVVPRQGGETFQLGTGRPARSLKKQYQALGVAAWDRDGPLLYDGDRLLFVAGLGIDARAWAVPGEPQLALRWQRDEPADDAG